MKNDRLKVILLVAAVLMLSIGSFATVALLKSEAGSVLNQFFAANVYTLEYNLNAGDDTTDPAKITKQTYIGSVNEMSHEFTVSEKEITREGYEFMGWAESPDAADVEYYPGDMITLNSEQPKGILYAVWKENLKFVLNYNLNYDGAPIVDVQEVVVSGTQESYTFTVQDIPNDVLNEGYIFLGWAESETATEAEYVMGDSVSVTYDESIGKAEKTLYAVWAEDTGYVNYSIIFDSNLPSDVAVNEVTDVAELAVRNKNAEHTFTLTSNQKPVVNDFDETGLVFVGWATSEDGMAEYDPDDNTCNTVTLIAEEGTESVSVTLYAVWEREYYIVYKSTVTSPEAVKYVSSSNEVAGDNEPISLVTRKQEVSVIGSYEETGYYYKRSGYVLVGFTEENGQTAIENIELTTPGRNHAKTLYAIWTEGSYAVMYDANGGSGAPATQVATVSATTYAFNIQFSNGLTPNAGAYDAEFLGWAYDADALAPDFVYNSASNSFTPVTLTLTEQKPTTTLYAVWKYHYVVTFDKGYGDEGSVVPETMEYYTTNKTYRFDMPTADEYPYRAGYEFMGYYSDELDRRNGENRYYDGSYGDDFVTSITLESGKTHITLYARFDPLSPFILTFDANGGSNAPAAVTKPDTEDWQCIFLIPDNEPTLSSNTFVGWAESPDADYTWLDSNDPDKKIYGGYSEENIYTINGDKSTEQTLYAVWAPDHYIRVYIDYNGGAGWYQRVYSETDCGTTSYYWDEPVPVTSTRSDGRVVKFDEYYNSTDNVFTINTVGGVAGSASNYSSSNIIYGASRENYIFRGFSTGDNDVDPEYTTEKGNLSIAGASTQASQGTSASSGQFRSSGYYTIRNVPIDIDTATRSGSYGNGGSVYSITLYAQWKSTVDYYRIIAVDPANGNAVTVLKNRTAVTIVEGQKSSCTFNANTVWSSFAKTGYICDFAYTPNATQADFTVSSTWVAESNIDVFDVSNITKIQPYQKWSIDSAITLTPDSPYVTKEYDANLLSDVYTLTLYPVWQKGQLFTLTVNSPSASGGTLYRRWYQLTSWDNYTQITSDSVTATARADAPSFTWNAGEAGEFYGPRSNQSNGYGNSKFLGYSYTSGGSGNVDFTVDFRTTSYTYDGLFSDYTGNQRWDTIVEPVTINAGNNGYTNSDGIPVSTLNLYAVWEPYKTYKVTFDPNGGTFGDYTSNISLVSYQNPKSSETYTFASSSSNYIYAPTRENYELLGFAYTQARANSGTVDISITSRSETTCYFNEPIVVKDKYDTATEGERVVTVSTSGAPHVTTLKLYAVWKEKQGYNLVLDYNTGVYTDDEGDEYYLEEHHAVAEAEDLYCDMTVTPKSPSLSGYKLLGYSYQPITPGTATAEQIENIDFPLDENGQIGPVRVLKNDPDDNHNSNTEEVDGADVTTLTLYAVWAESATYYRIIISSTVGTAKTATIPRTDSKVSTSYVFSANISVPTTMSRYGYRLAGLSYADDGVIDEGDFTVTNGKIVESITVSAGGQNVTMTTANNLNTYTLTLYAVWEKQNLFEIVIAPNNGTLLQSGGTYSSAQRNLLISGSSTYGADLDVRKLENLSGYYTTNKSVSASELAMRTDHTFLGGVSYSSDTEIVNYSFTQNTVSSTYRQTLSNLVIDLDDASQNITSRTETADDGSEITVYTLTLYPTYQKKQYFKVVLDPNDAEFRNSSGTVVPNFAFSSTTAHSNSTGTVSLIEYTGYNSIYTTNPGYILRGFSYTKNGPIDFAITTSNSDKKVSVGSVTIDKNNTEGKTISQSWHEAGGSQIETTTLTLYAVWGTRLSYSSASGTTNMPTTVNRIKPEADNRVFPIAEVKPANGNYTFLGWSSTNGGVAEYGVKGYYLELNNMELKDSYTLADNEPYKTLYAVWAQKYELRYAANGGDDASVPVNVISYSTASQEALSVSTTIPTREGYTFLGWADTADAAEAKYSATDSALLHYVTIDGASNGADTVKTVYAVWKENSSAQNVLNETSEGSADEPKVMQTEPENTIPKDGGDTE